MISHRFRPTLEQLERRTPAAVVQPTALEQAFLERINDVRSTRGLGPLAFDAKVQAGFRGYLSAPWRFLGQRIPPGVAAAKQSLKSAGFRVAAGASIYLRELAVPGFGIPTFPDSDISTFPDSATTQDALEQLSANAVLPDPSGFIPLLGELPRREHRVLGLVVEQPYNSCLPDRARFCPPLEGFADLPSLGARYVTTAQADPRPLLTGAVFRDGNGNGKYDPGEGLAGVTIRIEGQKGVQTFDSGGYTLAARRAGVVRVTASGGGLPGTLTQVVPLARGANTRLTFAV